MRTLLGAMVALVWLMGAVAPSEAQTPQDRGKYFPNLPVLDQDGRSLLFYDDVIKNRIVLISFIYTSCTDICPLTTARLRQVADAFGDRLGRDMFFVSISVDPTVDTPARLKAYADAFHPGPGWIFLTGSLENIRAINKRFGERMRSLSEHRQEIILGNDSSGEWQRNSVFGDLNRLVMDINAMDPAWRSRKRTIPDAARQNVEHKLDDRPGQVLFKKMCAACHAFQVGDRVGPDLYGVTQRRSRDWLTRFIMRPDTVRKQKDPVALALMAQFKGVRMPNLGLSENDAADLISYLDSQSKWLDTQRAESAKSVANSHHDHHNHGKPSANPQHSH